MKKLIIDGNTVEEQEIFDTLFRRSEMTNLIKEIFIDRELIKIELKDERNFEILSEFKKSRRIENEEQYVSFLQDNYLDEASLLRIITRPEKIVKLREEKWGPRAKSIYITNKENFDRVSYKRLQCGNKNVMQEVYFRIKEKEDNWESMAKIFHPGNPSADAKVGPVSVNNIENELLEAMRKEGEGNVIKPKMIGGQFVIAELERFEGTMFNDTIREQILQQELESWINRETTKLKNKITFVP